MNRREAIKGLAALSLLGILQDQEASKAVLLLSHLFS
jgi:hypothetical protein